MKKRVWLSLLVVILIAAIAAGSAGAGVPPNRLDDNRFKNTPVELASEVCNAIRATVPGPSAGSTSTCVPACTAA